MGAFDHKQTGAFTEQKVSFEPIPDTSTLEISSQTDDSWTVVARVKVTDEDTNWVTNRFLNLMVNQRGRMSQEAQLKLVDQLWLERLLISWSLPFPLDPNRTKALEKLTQQDRDYLYNSIMAKQPERQTQKKRLGERPASPALQEAFTKRRKLPVKQGRG